MKTIPPPCPEPEVGPKYWRSLDQLADTPEFRQWVEREFPAGASEFSDPVSRRYFVKIMSASFLLAGVGLTGCRRPEEHILPFAKMPQSYAHGVPQYYATSRPTRTGAVPLLVKSHDGRPTKIEGNPSHPSSNGGTDAFSQASILNLYDPDRATRFLKSGNQISREAALETLGELSKQFAANGGQGLAFLFERSSSPSRERVQKLIAEKLPKASWFVYEPVDFDIHREAASIAFGQAVRPEYRLEKAKRILSLDCDFIGAEENSFGMIRGFAAGRKIKNPSDEMNRLYIVEGLFTITGANADHRLRVSSSQVLPVAARIAVEILKQRGAGDIAASLTAIAAEFKGEEKWAVECAKDLLKYGKSSVVVAGYNQPLAVHLIAQAINASLESEAFTLRQAPSSKSGSIADLAKALNSGSVDSLVIVGGNPAYNAPADIDWVKVQGKAKTVVRLGAYEDETTSGVTLNLPAAHYLETWGDARTSDGTLVPVQPLIEPLFGGLNELEVLARLGGLNVTRPYDIVRETFKDVAKPQNLDESWKNFLHDGYLANSEQKIVRGNLNGGPVLTELKKVKVQTAPTAQQVEVAFYIDTKVDDGRYINNGWLQELPDPVTKLTWENAVLISPATAKALNLDSKEDQELGGMHVPVVKIEVAGHNVEGPIFVQPGMADNVVGVALGYGHSKTGRIGVGSGFNAFSIRTSNAPYFTLATLKNTGKTHLLAVTQSHWSMEGRPIIREANLEQFRQHPDFAKSMDFPEPAGAKPLYPNPLEAAEKSQVHQWGMVIDLSACVGCSACVVACQSENNVPIVGKNQVARSREMHWLRIDRYYTGDAQHPQAAIQPMLCQHCEAAPCENVCPVNATVHDQEGLNLMVYNRCVGTRYCSNNCPYKVRRFNFFDYNKRPLDKLYHGPLAKRPEDEVSLAKLVRNPDVSVRMRGVMEKCTFCVQRIEQAKITQKIKAADSGDIQVPSGTFTTACAQACPAEAIAFGNLKDPNSEVSKLKQDPRNYAVLDYLATRPRLTYMARVRNPNPQMPDYNEWPLTLKEVYPEKKGDPFEVHGSHNQDHANGHAKGAH